MRYEEAIKDYGKCLEFNPSDAEIYYERGLCHAQLGRFEMAIEQYNAAIKWKAKAKPEPELDADGNPVKKKRKTRKKKSEVIRRKLFWGVFNHAMKRVALYDFNQRKAAEKRAEELSPEGKPPHFVQKVKEDVVEPIDPDAPVEPPPPIKKKPKKKGGKT